MAESSKQPPTKPVVKRVVKKAPEPAASKPAVRYGRPVSQTTATETAPKPTVRTRQKKSSAKPDQALEETQSTRRISIPRPSIRKPTISRPTISKPSVSGLKDAAGSVGSGFVAVVRRLIAAVVGAFWLVVDTVRSWRLPRWDAVPASLATGVVVGLLSVIAGRLALAVFDWLRGVASGGGTWGTFTFVVVAFIAFVAGELMLSGFGVSNPRITSFLGVAITIVLILAVFLEESDSRMALVILPALAATSFTISHWLISAADASADAEA